MWEPGGGAAQRAFAVQLPAPPPAAAARPGAFPPLPLHRHHFYAPAPPVRATRQPYHPACAPQLLAAPDWRPPTRVTHCLTPPLVLSRPHACPPAAVAIFNQDLGAGMGASRTETYYRKAMVAKMVFGADGQTLTATSEEYSRRTAMVKPRGGAGRAVAAGKAGAVGGKAGGKRGDAAAEEEAAALELAVRSAGAVQDLDGADDGGGEQALPGQGQQVVTTVTAVTISSSSGTSSAATAAHQEHMAAQRQAVAAEAAAAAAAATSAEQQAADAEAVEQQQQQQQQAQQQQAAAEEEAAARQRQQQQEEQQAEQPAEPAGGAEAAEDVEAWWSDVIAPSGERLPKAAKRERDISASLATAGGHGWARQGGGAMPSGVAFSRAAGAALCARASCALCHGWSRAGHRGALPAGAGAGAARCWRRPHRTFTVPTFKPTLCLPLSVPPPLLLSLQ